MRRFLVLLKKELAELLTLQMFLPFIIVIIMFVSIGGVISDVGGQADKGAIPVGVVDADNGTFSPVVLAALEQAGLKPVELKSADGKDAKALLNEAHANILLEIPKGFSAGLENGKPQQLSTTTRIEHFSFVGNSAVTALSGATALINSALASAIAAEAAPDVSPQMLQAPVTTTENVVIGNREAQTSAVQVMSFVSQQTTLIPIVLFVVVIFASQMIATTIATEKENKTLETLLSYPVSRTSIVTSKMLAAGIVALLVGIAYMFGITRYISGIEASFTDPTAADRAATASEAAMRQLGLTLGTSDYVLMGLTLFAGILVALAISIILGAFAENVKAVQSLLTPMMVLMMVPYFLTMFLDLSSLPDGARLAVLAIPFTYLFTAGPNLFLGNYAAVWWGIAYQFLWFAVFVTIAARVFSSDRILTMKLNLSRKRKATLA
jgi:ABC-2 type transport system permease protein